MSLMRCDSCGSLRWSLRAKPGEGGEQHCEVCGGTLKPERRRPGRRFGKDARERRDVRAPGGVHAPGA